VLVFANSIPYVRTKEAGVDDRFVSVTVSVEFDPIDTVPNAATDVWAVAVWDNAPAKAASRKPVLELKE
jgi:hypothetical protein